MFWVVHYFGGLNTSCEELSPQNSYNEEISKPVYLCVPVVKYVINNAISGYIFQYLSTKPSHNKTGPYRPPHHKTFNHLPHIVLCYTYYFSFLWNTKKHGSNLAFRVNNGNFILQHSACKWVDVLLLVFDFPLGKSFLYL